VPATQRLPGLEEDLAQERVEWRLERVSWMLLLLAVLAAAVGLTGPGPLSSSRVSEGPVTLTYSGAAHRGASTELELQIAADALPGGDRLEVAVIGPWLAATRLVRVEPEPETMTLRASRLELGFRRPADGPLIVRLRATGERSGSATGEIAVARRPPLPFRQFIFP
jgi:hypothetical protein